MVTMQPRPEFVQYRENVPQWRVWNCTEGDFPPFALVALARDVGPGNLNLNIARTAYDMHPWVPRHAADRGTDNQLTYEVYSGPQRKWLADVAVGEEIPGYHRGILYDPGFFYIQSPETYLAVFDRGLKKNTMGLATQHWPVLTRFVGESSSIPDTWPRYAVPDMDRFGVKLHDDGPFQILDVHPNKLPDCSLVWIAPRSLPCRDAWSVGSVDLVDGNGSWQEIKEATDVLNSPGGDDVLTVEDGRIVAHKLGLYRGTVTAIVSGSVSRLAFLEPGSPSETPAPGRRGVSASSSGWLPQGTLESQGHSHSITVTGGAAYSYPWDRTTSTLTYTSEFLVDSPAEIPWQAKLLWNGAEGESLSRVRYHIEYIGPADRT